MSTFLVILLVILFCSLQVVLIKKGRKNRMKYFPIAIGGIGVAAGFVVYYISYLPFLLEIQSKSVLSENQYFALMICVLFMPCFVGALLGIVIGKFLGKKQILYFFPFILSIVVYLCVTFLGLGMISVKEMIWMVLFFIGGLLLSKEKIWGCMFGMIPGIAFVWMSSNDTGQVVNIELPLGIIIIGFFVGCGIGVYRKKYLSDKIL